MKPKKLSLLAAIVININIIIGAGVFLNIKPLAKLAGPLSPLGYALGALILAPFVFTLAKLATAHPVAGGLYVYSKTHIGRFAGFLSGWLYFVGKTVSAAFLAFAFTGFFQSNISWLHPYPTLLLTTIVIFSLTLLHILGTSIGGKIQYIFLFIKLIPLLFVFIFAFTIFQPSHFYVIVNSPIMQTIKPLISIIPLVLYSLMGFEITCSIAHLIERPERNIFWAITGSFVIVATLYFLFQGALFGALGSKLLGSGQPLTLLANKFFAQYPFVGKSVTALVFTSVIAGSFGILTSNCWNLHTLATQNFFPGTATLTQLSNTNVPWVSLLLESTLACVIIGISKNLVALQSMSVFGVIASFLLSSIAAFIAAQKKVLSIPRFIPLLAIAGCTYTLFLCFQNMQKTGVSLPYLFVLIAGIVLAKKAFLSKN